MSDDPSPREALRRDRNRIAWPLGSVFRANAAASRKALNDHQLTEDEAEVLQVILRQPAEAVAGMFIWSQLMGGSKDWKGGRFERALTGLIARGLVQERLSAREMELRAYDAAEASGRRLERGVGLAMSLAVVTLTTVVTSILARKRGATPQDFGVTSITAWVTGITALLGFIYATVQSRIESRKELGVTEAILQAERGAVASEAPTQVALGLLEAASGRERLSRSLMDGRLAWLYRIGVSLVVLAVFAPLAALFVYYSQDPLQDLQRAKELGISIPNTAVMTRDWHPLLAGGSIGLLLLAAARGALNSEARQREAHVAAARREKYYDDMGRALQIADHLAKRAPDKWERVHADVLRRILTRLLDGNSADPETKPPAGLTDDAALLAEHLKTLGGQLTK